MKSILIFILSIHIAMASPFTKDTLTSVAYTDPTDSMVTITFTNQDSNTRFFIPVAPDNAEWKEIQKWVSMGNQIQQYVTDPAVDQARQLDTILQLNTKVMILNSELQTEQTSNKNKGSNYQNLLQSQLDSINATLTSLRTKLKAKLQ